MIVVTGGAGFIGSNIVKGLNERGFKDILVVDNLTKGQKFINIADCEIADYLDKDLFLSKIHDNAFANGQISAIFHEGACSSTTEWDGKFMMHNNYEFSKSLLEYSLKNEAAFLYASSASVYGSGSDFREQRACEAPINMYAYSKFLFDQTVRRVAKDAKSQVVGFRYFNVYGPREQHKGTMASVAFHFNHQILQHGELSLFEGTDGYGHGEQRRDFVYVGDAVKVNLWFLEHPHKSGIFNLGTGNSQSFNDVANAVIRYQGKGTIRYIPFPEHLKGRYQSFTQADISALRSIGYEEKFHSVEEGVNEYLCWLNA